MPAGGTAVNAVPPRRSTGGAPARERTVPRLPLARTYRPQRFAEVLGQQIPVRALGAAAAGGQVASAYIFSGTRGIGKTTIARLFAKTLNCAAGPGTDCCDTCTACREIAEGRALDVLELDAATHTGIDDIRELRDAAQYPPTRDRYRVFILDEAHQLSQSAWNGLLKVLEEPPSWCVFLFCTTEPHKIPATIESRALHFSFRSPTPVQIREHLAKVAAQEKITLEPEALDLLVQAADGSVRDGLSALDQVHALSGGAIAVDAVRSALGLVPGEAVARFVRAALEGDAAAALGVVAELDDEGQDLRAFVADALERVRRLALVQAVGAQAVPDGAALADDAKAAPLEQLVWSGRVLDETESRLRQGGPQRALLDLATVRLSRMAGLPALGELVDRLAQGGGAPGGASGGGPAGRGQHVPRESAPPRTAPARPVSAPAPTGPPRRTQPAEPEYAPAPPPPRPTPSASANASASTGASAGANAAANPGLLDALVHAVTELRPGLAAFLRSARTASFGDDDVLRLVFPADKGMMGQQVGRPSMQPVLFEAVKRAAGRAPASVQIETAGEDGGDASPPSARTGRREALERAKKEPVVRALFDRFGAVIVDGQILAPAPPPPEEP